MLLRILRPPLHVGSDRRRRRVEDVGLVAFDDLPPPVFVGKVGCALVDDPRGAVGERPEDDVAVSGDPADVGCAPVNRFRLDVEDVVVRGRDADEIAGGGVDDAFGFGGRAARVEQVQQILRVHGFAGAVFRVVVDFLQNFVSPDVPALGKRHVASGAPHDQAAFDGRRVLHRGVRVCFQGHLVAAPPSLVLGDHQLALHVVHATGKRLGAEASEDDREGRPDAGTGEHRDRQFGNHPHVDADVSALFHAELLQSVGEADDLFLQVAESDLTAVAYGLAFPEVRDLVPMARFDVAVDAVETGVELAAEVPLGVGRLPLVELVPRLEEGYAP